MESNEMSFDHIHRGMLQVSEELMSVYRDIASMKTIQGNCDGACEGVNLLEAELLQVKADSEKENQCKDRQISELQSSNKKLSAALALSESDGKRVSEEMRSKIEWLEGAMALRERELVELSARSSDKDASIQMLGDMWSKTEDEKKALAARVTDLEQAIRAYEEKVASMERTMALAGSAAFSGQAGFDNGGPSFVQTQDAGQNGVGERMNDQAPQLMSVQEVALPSQALFGVHHHPGRHFGANRNVPFAGMFSEDEEMDSADEETPRGSAVPGDVIQGLSVEHEKSDPAKGAKPGSVAFGLDGNGSGGAVVDHANQCDGAGSGLTLDTGIDQGTPVNQFDQSGVDADECTTPKDRIMPLGLFLNTGVDQQTPVGQDQTGVDADEPSTPRNLIVPVGRLGNGIGGNRLGLRSLLGAGNQHNGIDDFNDDHDGGDNSFLDEPVTPGRKSERDGDPNGGQVRKEAEAADGRQESRKKRKCVSEEDEEDETEELDDYEAFNPTAFATAVLFPSSDQNGLVLPKRQRNRRGLFGDEEVSWGEVPEEVEDKFESAAKKIALFSDCQKSGIIRRLFMDDGNQSDGESEGDQGAGPSKRRC